MIYQDLLPTAIPTMEGNFLVSSKSETVTLYRFKAKTTILRT